MVKRMRMVAGPNGSGKSTLVHRLAADYAVNFYDFLNADDIFAEVKRTGAYFPRLPVDNETLKDYAARSSYDQATKDCFLNGGIRLVDDCVRFSDEQSVNSYTIALLTNFLQAECIRQGRSFSQETVFSHISKVAALKAAKAVGYRTYLYFVATNTPRINLGRVANRAKEGGHDVPADKIVSRYTRSLELLPRAFEHLSRAYFFDNSGDSMRYLAQWNPEAGLLAASPDEPYPNWMKSVVSAIT